MNKYANGEALLIATSASDGVHIRAVFPSTDGDQQSVDVVVDAGDTFGGRTFAEWQMIAVGSGVVEASWLRV